MNQITQQLFQFFNEHSLKQKIIIVTVLIVFVSILISLLLWANRTEFELLYSNLDPAAASAIVSDLRNDKISYRLENGGTTIYAPKDMISELRLQHAQSGYLKDAISGYELFENNKMGMTTFMQKLNMKRALEGELMRTINQFSEVKQSRVHLVIPKDHLFEEEKAGSASVVLHMRPGASLNHNQLKGIAALVANSVEGIETENVVVMDADGAVLHEGPKDTGVVGNVNNQYQLQQNIESAMQRKVSEIVSGIVGKQNNVIKVSVELNFDQIERTTEEVDPDNVVKLSEEKYVESSKSGIDSSDFVVEKTTTNYELSKRLERYISNSGDIKRLTVAVLVNGRYNYKKDESGESIAEYQPRSSEELRQIEALVKSAVGYNENREDIVEVRNMKLEALPRQQQVITTEEPFRFDMWQQIITYGLIGLGILLAFILLRGLLKTSVNQLLLTGETDDNTRKQIAEKPKPKALPEEEEISEDLYIKKLTPEARAKLKAKDKMTREVLTFASERPEDATKLLRSWLTEGGA